MPTEITKIISIIFSLMLLLNAVYVRNIVGTWLFPACIYSFLWFCYTFIPLVTLFYVPINLSSIIFIYISSIVYTLSFLLFDWDLAFKISKSRIVDDRVLGSSFLHIVLYLSAFTAFICLIVNIVKQGITLFDIMANFLDAAGQFASLRYKGELNQNIFGQLSLLLSNVAVIIGGFVYSFTVSSYKRKAIVFISFLPSLGIMLFQSAKGLFFLSVSFFIGSLIVSKISTRDFSIDIKQIILKSFYVIVIILPLVVLSFMSRGLQKVDDINFIFDRLRSSFATYSCGHVYAFSDWFSFYTSTTSSIYYGYKNMTYGFYTLMSFFRFFGDTTDIPMGTYDEYFIVDDVLFTNIFTIYRGMITDFGIFGSMVCIFMIGLVCHYIYVKLIISSNPTISAAAFVFVVGFIYISYTVSILTWNVMPATFIIVSLILIVNNRMNNSCLYTFDKK